MINCIQERMAYEKKINSQPQASPSNKKVKEPAIL